MTAWTPGPWSIHAVYDSEGDVTDCSANGFIAHTMRLAAGDVLLGELVAMRFSENESDKGFPRVSDFDENKANARLCIAAPDLYEALMLYQHAVESGMVEDDLRAAYHRAGVALSRATGETK